MTWDARVLELGKPDLMDTPTLIEWIERQLETPEETEARHAAMVGVTLVHRIRGWDEPLETTVIHAEEIVSSRISPDAITSRQPLPPPLG